jgi:hypothetical protein
MSFNIDDYVCTLIETGEEFDLPDKNIGFDNLDDYKHRCANFGAKLNPTTKKLDYILRLIKKNDWINPKEKYSCFKLIKDTKTNKMVKAKKPSGDYDKFFTKSECNINSNTTSYQINDAIVPTISYQNNYPDKKKISSVNNNIIFLILIIISLIYLIWYIKYNDKRPYYLYDYISQKFINRLILIVIFIGIIILYFCPFRTCILPITAPLFRKNPLKYIYTTFCNNNSNNIGCSDNNTICDNISWFPGCNQNNNTYMGWINAYNRSDKELQILKKEEEEEEEE